MQLQLLIPALMIASGHGGVLPGDSIFYVTYNVAPAVDSLQFFKATISA